MSLRIRAESEGDHAAVHALHAAAFETDAEARLVDTLRRDARPLVSLVAERDGRLAGHILFSPVALPGHDALRLMGLAPMAVEPAHQKTGIGSALVHAGLEACRAAGMDAVVVLGHPEYYPRFGFTPAEGFGIACAYDVPAPVFMARELRAGALTAASGTVEYHPAFAGV